MVVGGAAVVVRAAAKGTFTKIRLKFVAVDINDNDIINGIGTAIQVTMVSMLRIWLGVWHALVANRFRVGVKLRIRIRLKVRVNVKLGLGLWS